MKTLTTLQIEDDKDLLDYFSFLIAQTHFNSISTQHQQQLSSKKSLYEFTNNELCGIY